MALLVLHDPYEWFDPEKGRMGILIHSSQIGGYLRRDHNPPLPEQTWPEVWEEFDENKRPR